VSKSYERQVETHIYFNLGCVEESCIEGGTHSDIENSSTDMAPINESASLPQPKPVPLAQICCFPSPDFIPTSPRIPLVVV